MRLHFQLLSRVRCARIAGAITSICAAISTAHACTLPLPTGDVILSVSGAISDCNKPSEVQFDLKMLESLPSMSLSVTNPWDAGRVVYKGVLLRDLMAFVQAEGSMATFDALNDYHADIKFRQMEKRDVILAYRRDGDLIPVRDKGPLFVVFPNLDTAEHLNNKRYGQSVWQVYRIEVK